MNSLEYTPVKTIRLKASCNADLDLAAALLAQNKIVALPTETVYGLAANALDEHAIKRIFLAKGRPLNNPLIVHVHDIATAARLFNFREDKRAEERFLRLATRFWPGPLTIIAKRAAEIPLLATAGLDTVAVRVPKNPATLRILQKIAFPLVMPSANLSTRPSPTCADHVLATLDGRIEAVVDDGSCEVGIESTVVRIDTDEIVILRPGIIDDAEINACLDESVRNSLDEESNTLRAPGQMALHYSPNIKAVHVCSMSEASTFWHSDANFLARISDLNSLKNRSGNRPINTHCFQLSDDSRLSARELYHHLYVAERDPEKSLVVVIPDDDDQGWRAIIDRLKRTARQS